jgi:hypothetical protein
LKDAKKKIIACTFLQEILVIFLGGKITDFSQTVPYLTIYRPGFREILVFPLKKTQFSHEIVGIL